MKLSARVYIKVDGDAAVRFGDVDETEGVQVAGCPALAGAGGRCRYGVGVRDGGPPWSVLWGLLWRLFSAGQIA